MLRSRSVHSWNIDKQKGLIYVSLCLVVVWIEMKGLVYDRQTDIQTHRDTTKWFVTQLVQILRRDLVGPGSIFRADTDFKYNLISFLTILCGEMFHSFKCHVVDLQTTTRIIDKLCCWLNSYFNEKKHINLYLITMIKIQGTLQSLATWRISLTKLLLC